MAGKPFRQKKASCVPFRVLFSFVFPFITEKMQVDELRYFFSAFNEGGWRIGEENVDMGSRTILASMASQSGLFDPRKYLYI